MERRYEGHTEVQGTRSKADEYSRPFWKGEIIPIMIERKSATGKKPIHESFR